MSKHIKVIDRVVIAGGVEPRSRAFAGLQQLANGDLLVGYRVGSDHIVTDDGAVVTVRSKDAGRTWGEPRPVVSLPGWDSGGGNRIIQTPDGDLIMFWFKARRSNPDAHEYHVYPTRSTDYGHTWGPFGPELKLFPGWTEPHAVGHMHVLSDGRWMMSVYGSDQVGGTTYSGVAFSDDRGQTWGDMSVVARGPAASFYETALIRLKDERFLAAIRTQDPPFTTYRAYSEDEGRTWTHPEPLPFLGQTPFLFELRSGAILCLYRDRDPSRPGISASVTLDGGTTWEDAGRLYLGTDWNCGYPSMVRLPNGVLLCVYYSCYENGSSEVHGMFLEETV